MPGVGSSSFPMIEDALLLCRVLVNDTFKGATQTPGEGRIFVDSAPFILPLLNAALQDYQRDLDNAGVPTLTNRVVLTSIPPVNGPNGVGVPDPSIEQRLSYTGFFDGLTNYATPALPSDLLAPKVLKERTSSTGLTFTKIDPAQGGDVPSRNQAFSLGNWVWRGNSIFWNGALITKDATLLYTQAVALYGSALPPAQFPSTPLPFRDSVEPLALLMAEKFCSARLADGATNGLISKYNDKIAKVINRQIRDLQSVNYSRGSYGEDEGDGMFGNW